MHISQRIRSITPAPMDEINARVATLRREGADVISLGQGVPGFPPATGAIRSARQALRDPTTHLYSADAGLLSLRRMVSAWLAEQNHIAADADTEIFVTAGANQAFMVALLTLLDPGDEVLLPSPFYFNHEMSIRVAGGVPLEVPLPEETGFQLTLEELEPYLERQPRALVVTSPNNPTGAVYDPEELQRIARVAASRGVGVITDETYQDFLYEGAEHFSMASIPEARPQVITTGSFSKIFSLTGWRVGYMIAEPAFLEQALKVQDSMIVCAAVISQIAALGALRDSLEEVPRRREILGERRLLLQQLLAETPQVRWKPTRGAFFAFVGVEGCTDSAAMARDILERAHVATVPGSAFGQSGEGYLRLSYGSAEKSDLEEACRRLAEYFRST
jgi:aspartate/methionine/tyrosine aminotransferase